MTVGSAESGSRDTGTVKMTVGFGCAVDAAIRAISGGEGAFCDK